MCIKISVTSSIQIVWWILGFCWWFQICVFRWTVQCGCTFLAAARPGWPSLTSPPPPAPPKLPSSHRQVSCNDGLGSLLGAIRVWNECSTWKWHYFAGDPVVRWDSYETMEIDDYVDDDDTECDISSVSQSNLFIHSLFNYNLYGSVSFSNESRAFTSNSDILRYSNWGRLIHG